MNIFPNYDFLRKFQEMQLDITFDDFIDLGFAIIGYSKTDKTSYWNYALLKQEIGEKELNNLVKLFKDIDRNPEVYFENTVNASNLTKFLVSQDYEKSFEDCWQFWKNGIIDERYFDSVKKVTNSAELATFLETFDSCYQKDDPQNPYGELGDYLKVTESAWYKHNESNKLEYFIVYKDDRPVAVATLTNYNGLGYISNVGSLRDVRGEGYGKAVTLYCVRESIQNGNTEHCLSTEEGHYPNKFYKRIGFETRFTAVAYSKKQP